MAILGRSNGIFTSAASITVTPSGATFGTGTVIVVEIHGNTTFATPSGWTQRHSSVVNLGLYAFDRTGAGETSFAFPTGATGSGQWYAWELSAGSTYVIGSIGQTGSAINYTLAAITPTAGARHLLAVGGGAHPSLALTVTGYSNSFALGAGGQALAQDQPFSARGELDVTADGVTSYGTVATFSNTTSGSSGGVLLAYVNASAGDVTPPSVPTGLGTTAIGSTTADLSWTASTDNVAVTGYEIQIIGP